MLTGKIIVFFLAILISSGYCDRILVYMDNSQQNHLKAYGAAYYSLTKGYNVEWLLNYRGGSFLLQDVPELENWMRLRGVSYERIPGELVAEIYKTIDENNMEVILLEKAPKIGVFIPPFQEMWDDAVVLALEYAEIPFKPIWYSEVINNKLQEFDWLHCHHEDFTGQYGKFYSSFRNTQWYKRSVAMSQEIARSLGFNKFTDLAKAAALKIKEYIASGGFAFAMCSATDTYDIALAALGVDIVGAEFDGDPPDPDCQKKLNYDNCLAFTDFTLEMNPFVYEHSDIDASPQEVRNAQFFQLFDFSAKYDPVPTMLVQNHTGVVADFLGQTTAFKKKYLKRSVVVLAEYPNIPFAKYIHGNFGRGTFTFLAGHDPEDYQHLVGDPPTDLNLHKNSPGYRLILNNVLFPAARKKNLKT